MRTVTLPGYTLPNRPVLSPSQITRERQAKVNLPSSPRFGMDPFAGIALLLLGGITGFTGVIATLFLAVVGVDTVDKIINKGVPNLEELDKITQTIKDGNIQLLGKTEIKKIENRTEKLTRLILDGKEYRFFEITVDALEDRFFGRKGKAMVHYKLADTTGDNHIEYTEKVSDSKNQRLLKIKAKTSPDSPPCEIQAKNKKIPPEVTTFFETLKQVIDDIQQEVPLEKPVTMFSLTPQLLVRDDLAVFDQKKPVQDNTAQTAFVVEEEADKQLEVPSRRNKTKEAGR